MEGDHAGAGAKQFCTVGPVWKSNFYGAALNASSSTPSARRLLDGVADAGSSPLDGASTAASLPRNDLVKNYRTRLISTQVGPGRHVKFWTASKGIRVDNGREDKTSSKLQWRVDAKNGQWPTKDGPVPCFQCVFVDSTQTLLTGGGDGQVYAWKGRVCLLYLRCTVVWRRA